MNALELRRSLHQASQHWATVAENTTGADLPAQFAQPAAAEMAYVYPYALAAALAIVEQIAGSDIADEVAVEIEDLLTNGDTAGWNDDLNNPETASA